MSKEDFGRSARVSLTRPPPRRRFNCPPRHWQTRRSALLLVNKQLSAEYGSFVYKHSMHHFIVDSRNAQLVPFWTFPPALKPLVRKCQIRIGTLRIFRHHCAYYLWRDFEKTVDDFQAQMPGVLGRIKDLALSMPNLSELELVYNVDSSLTKDGPAKPHQDAAWDLLESLKALPSLQILSISISGSWLRPSFMSVYEKAGTSWTLVARQLRGDLEYGF